MCLVCVTIVVVSDLILCLGVDNRFLYDFTTWGKWFLVILYQDISATTMELCWVSMKLSPRLRICIYQETCQHLWSIYMYSAYICTRVFEWWQKESWSLMILLTYDLSLMTMMLTPLVSASNKGQHNTWDTHNDHHALFGVYCTWGV